MIQFLKVCGVLLCLAAAVPFSYYVWPTKYRYDRIHLGGSEFPVRIHRVTGDAEQLTTTGWQPLRPAQPAVDSLGKPTPGALDRGSPTPTPRR